MRKIFQTRFSKTDGNCWPACLATIFDVPLADVDHCHCGLSAWGTNTDEWLARRGLYFLQLDYEKLSCVPPHGSLVCFGLDVPEFHVVVGRVNWISRYPSGDCLEYRAEILHDPAGMRPRFEDYDIRRVIVFGQIIPSNG